METFVMKFGGTSLASAARFTSALRVASNRGPRGVLVVVSAVAGTTDGLMEAGRAAERGELDRATAMLRTLEETHRHILTELDPASPPNGEMARVFRDLAESMAEISERGEFDARVRDRVVGEGEFLSAHLFTVAGRASGIDVSFVDARELVVTDARFGAARPDHEATTRNAQARLGPLLARGLVVTQGFVGSTDEGEPTTLGRGGSDYSASLLGAALDVAEIQIWTDVPGMLTADHRVVPDGVPIGQLSFREAAELAYFGAKVLHPLTIEPAVARNIPVRILDSSRPRKRGTLISSRLTATALPVKSIASKRGITIVHVRSLRMLMAHGFLRAIFDVFDRLEIPVDLVTTSEVSVSLTLDDDRRVEEAVRALSSFGEVRVERGQAIVCLVGEGLGRTPGLVARALSSLADIRTHMVSQGASEINLSVVVDESAVEEVVRRLHREFFSKLVEADARFQPLSAGEAR